MAFGTVADLREGNNSKSVDTNVLFSQYFPTMCMQMREIGPGPHISGVAPSPVSTTVSWVDHGPSVIGY